jgi:hypothetical protein
MGNFVTKPTDLIALNLDVGQARDCALILKIQQVGPINDGRRFLCDKTK